MSVKSYNITKNAVLVQYVLWLMPLKQGEQQWTIILQSENEAEVHHTGKGGIIRRK